VADGRHDVAIGRPATVEQDSEEAEGPATCTDNRRQARTLCPHSPSSTYTRPSVAAIVSISRRNVGDHPVAPRMSAAMDGLSDRTRTRAGPLPRSSSASFARRAFSHALHQGSEVPRAGFTVSDYSKDRQALDVRTTAPTLRVWPQRRCPEPSCRHLRPRVSSRRRCAHRPQRHARE